ncbi:MAG: HlyC/CorC family transporter [Steroidobacteraceae bacterium]
MQKGADDPAGGNATGRWLKRLKRSVAGEPEDREALLESLRGANARGLLDADALGMIEGVLDVADLRVRDIMIPRAQMVFVRRNDPAAVILPKVVESGHSRFPVMDDDRDDIVGILLAKDLLRVFAEGGTERFDIRECMRPAVFVPEAKRVNVLLKEFRGNRNHMAIVVDEYGGVAGVLTIEDVIEQIVGEIDDEFDVEEDLDIRKDAERQFTVRGVTLIEEFNEFFGTSFPDDEFDTVAGLVMKEFGRLPRRGDTVEIGGLEFRVTRADRRRVESLRVTTAQDVIAPDDRAVRDGD